MEEYSEQKYFEQRVQDANNSQPTQPIRSFERTDEIAWDTLIAMLSMFIGGFGTSGVQIYIKRFLAFTGFHTGSHCFSRLLCL
jgi:hypothetical protein